MQKCELSEDEIREKAKIFKKEPLKRYHKELNKVSGDICVKDPALLFVPRDKLMERARQTLHESGFQYVKKKSRSKQFGSESSDEPVKKRSKISTEVRRQRISQINEELNTINTQLSFKEERIKIGMQRRDFKLCDQLSDEVDILQKRKRVLEIELLSLQKKEEKSKKYQLQKKLESKKSECNVSASSSDSEHLFTPVKSDNLVQQSRVPMSTPVSPTEPSCSRTLFTPPISFSGRISSLVADSELTKIEAKSASEPSTVLLSGSESERKDPFF